MFSLPLVIPETVKRQYQIARVILYGIVITSTCLFVFQTLFPTLVFSFNFRTPNSSKNNLIDPRTEQNSLNTNGKMNTNEVLFSTASTLGTFSQAQIELILEKKSAPLETMDVSLRRSYRSFFLPVGTVLTVSPLASLYKIDDIYYELRENILFPFVSENAYHSRYQDTDARTEESGTLSQYTFSDTFIGYRIGSTVSFADGVFLIVSETEMRPFGSAEIFLALGYRFEDVIPASEEEIGIYKRGRIITLGIEHPDGTLFLDQDTKISYLIENGTKRPIENTEYLTFLTERQTPIIASSKMSAQTTTCTLKPGILGQSLSCQTPITMLPSGFGNDFEITLKNESEPIDINTLQVSLKTEASKQNMLSIISKIKQRLLVRFGFGE